MLITSAPQLRNIKLSARELKRGPSIVIIVPLEWHWSPSFLAVSIRTCKRGQYWEKKTIPLVSCFCIPSKNLYTKEISFIQSSQASQGYSCPKPRISFSFLIQQEKLIVLLPGLISEFVSISWIIVFSADQEDWKTEDFCMIFRLCLPWEQNGENAPLSATLPHGGVELVRTVIGNSLFWK